jgi:hypothetical protein
VRCISAGAPLLEVARERVEPDLSPREEGSVCVGQKTRVARPRHQHQGDRHPVPSRGPFSCQLHEDA